MQRLFEFYPSARFRFCKRTSCVSQFCLETSKAIFLLFVFLVSPNAAVHLKSVIFGQNNAQNSTFYFLFSASLWSLQTKAFKTRSFIGCFGRYTRNEKTKALPEYF